MMKANLKHPRSSKGLRSKAGKGVMHAFVPHAENEYHPHLIRPLGLLIVGVISGLLFTMGLQSPRVASVNGAPADITKQALLTASNDAREDEGIPALILNDQLSSAAGLKARDILVNQYWDHTSPTGVTPWYWYREVNYRYDFAGENLAKGFVTSNDVVTGWLNSEEHRKSALNASYEDVGFGIVEGNLNGEQTTIVVAMYGSPVGSPALRSPEVLAAAVDDLTPVTRFGLALQSMNPMMLGSVAILMTTTIVALTTYAFRNKLPKSTRRSWKKHHALYKALITACLIVIMITLYGGGEIL